MSEFKSSYAIIPCYILDDDKLDEGAKSLYARISMYSNEGRCWASNQHFADKQKVTIRCIQNWLKQLTDAGYIEVEIERGGFQTKRNIWITNDFKKFSTTRTTVHPPLHDISPAPAPHFMQINTSNINTREQQQQQEVSPPIVSAPQPIAAAVAFYTCLREKTIRGEFIPDSEKRWLMDRYDEATVQQAIAYCISPKVKIKSSVIQTIKWACQTKPSIPIDKAAEEQQIVQDAEDLKIANRDFANDLVVFAFNKTGDHRWAIARNDYLEINCDSQSGSVKIYYKEAAFKKMAEHEFRKKGIIK